MTGYAQGPLRDEGSLNIYLVKNIFSCFTVQHLPFSPSTKPPLKTFSVFHYILKRFPFWILKGIFISFHLDLHLVRNYSAKMPQKKSAGSLKAICLAYISRNMDKFCNGTEISEQVDDADAIGVGENTTNPIHQLRKW
jgi:hypothetical protein